MLPSFDYHYHHTRGVALCPSLLGHLVVLRVYQVVDFYVWLAVHLMVAPLGEYFGLSDIE